MKSLKRIIFAPHPPILIHEIGNGRERDASQTLEGLSKMTEIVNKIKPKLIVTITPTVMYLIMGYVFLMRMRSQATLACLVSRV